MSEKDKKKGERGIDSRFLKTVFSTISGKYDLVNKIITLGLDGLWRKKVAEVCFKNVRENGFVLDLCCGTGKMTDSLVRVADNKERRKNKTVIGVDFCKPMLEVASKNSGVIHKNFNVKVIFLLADATRLPFKDGFFDCVSIAFGLRNLLYENPSASTHLKEIFRVLTDGGKFVAIESGKPRSSSLKVAFSLYTRLFAFPVGRWITGSKDAYEYLIDSANNFYEPEEMVEILRGAGFQDVHFERLFFGSATLYVAEKIF